MNKPGTAQVGAPHKASETLTVNDARVVFEKSHISVETQYVSSAW